jgi:PPOX class probable F420-dependent enzyme
MRTGVERLRGAVVGANKRMLVALRSADAASVVELPVQSSGFSSLRGSKHCLVVTYRKDGRPVAQPVWPGYDGDRAYIWTEINAYKAKRLRKDPRALIAPCSFRGKPLGPPVAARGRILETDAERAHAERVIRSQWGWKRKLYERISRAITDVHYIELVPAGGEAPAYEALVAHHARGRGPSPVLAAPGVGQDGPRNPNA